MYVYVYTPRSQLEAHLLNKQTTRLKTFWKNLDKHAMLEEEVEKKKLKAIDIFSSD